MNKRAYITSISKFLPNTPVSNEDMETYLGTIDNTPSRAKSVILRSNGITQRYYALDKNGNTTHTNAQLAAESIKRLSRQHMRIDDIELIAAATSSPEMLIPSHGVMVHGELGTPPAEVVSFAGSCCTGIQALKYAYYSVLNRETNNAVCVASERISAWMRNQYFEVEAEALKQLAQKPILAFEKEFLRWMLSDGAAAALIHPFPAENTLSFIIEWIEIRSYAGMMKTCMYAGAEKNADGNLDGWASFPEKEWLSRSIFSLKQDTRLLEEHITRLGGHFLKEIMQKRKLIIPNVNWFLPHLSSMFFKSKIEEELKRLGINIPEDKWFINLPSTGNVGSASFLLMLEGLHSSGKLKKGDKILCMVPESARFSYGFCLLTAH